MAMLLCFVDDRGNSVFRTCGDVVPRVGEVVSYEVRNFDNEDWDPDVLETLSKLKAKYFQVTTVYHNFVKIGLHAPEHQTIMLEVVQVVDMDEEEDSHNSVG